MGGACGTNGGRDAYRFLVGKPVRKRPYGGPGCRWEDNIKIGHQEVVCGLEWCSSR